MTTKASPSFTEFHPSSRVHKYTRELFTQFHFSSSLSFFGIQFLFHLWNQNIQFNSNNSLVALNLNDCTFHSKWLKKYIAENCNEIQICSLSSSYCRECHCVWWSEAVEPSSDFFPSKVKTDKTTLTCVCMKTQLELWFGYTNSKLEISSLKKRAHRKISGAWNRQRESFIYTAELEHTT